MGRKNRQSIAAPKYQNPTHIGVRHAQAATVAKVWSAAQVADVASQAGASRAVEKKEL
jgi:hypothetical protein